MPTIQGSNRSSAGALPFSNPMRKKIETVEYGSQDVRELNKESEIEYPEQKKIMKLFDNVCVVAKIVSHDKLFDILFRFFDKSPIITKSENNEVLVFKELMFFITKSPREIHVYAKNETVLYSTIEHIRKITPKR